MFCSQCGKKLAENMLFCPFCGAAIVIPEQEGVKAGEAEDMQPKSEPAAEKPAAPQPEPKGPEFQPLRLEDDENDADWRAEIARKKAERAEQQSGEVRLDGRAPALDGSAPGSPDPQNRRAADTFVPPKPIAEEKLFLAEDDYDPYDDDDAEEDEDDYDYDEEDDDEEESFFFRHIRGFIALLLMVVLLGVFALYVFSDAGQKLLASANLSWRPAVYSELGYESFQNGDYDQAGLYYERALSRDPENYSSAQSAAASYLEAHNTQKAAEMLKKCIEIEPKAVEPYVYLKNLFPNATSRPPEITRILQGAYAATGDSRLMNIAE